MKLVFSFGEGKAEGDPTRRDLLGGKGAGLAEMTSQGLPVPPGFTISTEACRSFTQEGRLPDELPAAVDEALARVERELSTRFGDPEAPLLVSVRSGARASMPGMMDTILNLGLNDATMNGLAARTGHRRFALAHSSKPRSTRRGRASAKTRASTPHGSTPKNCDAR